MDAYQSTDALLRLGCFLSIFIAFAALESLFPRRRRRLARLRRWPANISISVLNQLLMRLLLPMSTMTLAIFVEQKGWGLFGQLPIPGLIEVIVAIVILDLAIYTQHVLYHAVPVLWRLHRMHHADLDFDVTTGIRFHPLSIVLSALIKFAVIIAVGPAVIAVLIFEILLNATSMFNHSNLKMPSRVEGLLRLVVVTPDMHRVHHSCDRSETNSNFGFNFPWWDRLFGTYRARPALGHTGMMIGLDQFKHETELRLDKMLSQPFRDSSHQ